MVMSSKLLCKLNKKNLIGEGALCNW